MDILDLLLDPLRSGIARRAMLEIVLLGAVCGALGFWVVVERLSYAAESLSHGLLPGLVLAALAGAPLLLGAPAAWPWRRPSSPWPRATRASARRRRTGVVVTGLVGLGALLALSPRRAAAPRRSSSSATRWACRIRTSWPPRRSPWAARRRWPRSTARLRAAFDDAGAGALGLPTGRLRLLLMGLLAVAVAVAVQGLGTLLALAVIVAPPVAVRRWSRSPGRALVLAGAAGAAAGVAGIYASYHLGTAAGASVALALCLRGPGGLRAAGPRSGRGRLERVPAHEDDRRAERDGHRQAHELRQGDPGHHRVVAPDAARSGSAPLPRSPGRCRTGRRGRSGRAGARAPAWRCPWRSVS